MDIVQKHYKLKGEYKNEYDFTLFLKHLDSNEFLQAIELIFTGNKKFLLLFFPSLRNIDRDEIAFDTLLDQPYYLIEKISSHCNSIFQRALEKFYLQESGEVIKKIISFSLHDIGLTNSFLQNVIFEKKVNSDIKLKLLNVLLQRKQDDQIHEFLLQYNIYNEPFLLPFILKYIGTSEEKQIRYYLTRLERIQPPSPDEEILKWFYSTLFDIISELLKNRRTKIIEFIISIDIQWYNKIIKKIIMSPEIQEEIKLKGHTFDINNMRIQDTEILNIPPIIENINNKYNNRFLPFNIAKKLYRLVMQNKSLLPLIHPSIRSQIILEKVSSSVELTYEEINTQLSDINSVDKLTSILSKN